MFQIIFGIVFPVVFGIWGFHSLWLGTATVVEASRSTHWQFVYGRVRSAQIAKRWSVGEPGVRPSIVYDYTVDGKEFSSERITFGMQDDFFSSADFAQKYVDRYPAGSRVQIFYDPSSPANAVLEPGLSVWTFVPSLIGLGLLISVCLLLLANAAGFLTNVD
jgi:hypothetical protein